MSYSVPRGQVSILDHMRWIAALLVVLQHARGFLLIEYYPGASLPTKAFYWFTGFSHSAVIVFFVLSGYLVGGKALRLLIEGSDAAQRNRFIVDRIARIVIVLWPALLLAGAVAMLAPRMPVLTVANWDGPNPSIVQLAGTAEWIGSALLLNETITRTVAFDSPLWSLAFEWTYYVIAIGFVCLIARDRRPIGLAAIGYMLLLVVLCLLLRPVILAMMACWLVGAIAARVRVTVSPWLSIPAFAAVLGYARLFPGIAGIDYAVAAVSALLLTTKGIRQVTFLPVTGARLAGFSFSLYAIHIPVMLALMSIMQASGLFLDRQRAGDHAFAGIALLLFTSYLIAFAFASITEAKTDIFRDFLYRMAKRYFKWGEQANSPRY